MNTTGLRQSILTFLCVSVVTAVSACNTEGLWSDRQASRGATAYESRSSDADVSNGAVDIAIADSHEVDLVEAVVTHRTQYRRNLEKLHTYYGTHGYAAKEQWAKFELDRLNKVMPFRYVMDAEIPSSALRATDKIEEADALYEKAVELIKRAGHGKSVLYRQDLMIEAARVFKDLIERYPTSDKIDDAAFYCGEIHKDYLPGQGAIAVRWYERVWTWNPDTLYPARFNAAVVYDFRLHDRDRALELYHGVVEKEATHTANVREATRRIHALTAESDASGRSVH